MIIWIQDCILVRIPNRGITCEYRSKLYFQEYLIILLVNMSRQLPPSPSFRKPNLSAEEAKLKQNIFLALTLGFVTNFVSTVAELKNG